MKTHVRSNGMPGLLILTLGHPARNEFNGFQNSPAIRLLLTTGQTMPFLMSSVRELRKIS